MYLNDHETAVDLLYYEAAAKTIVRLIRSTPSTPITIGVHGDWGAGKSSVLKMASSTLEKDENAVCIWFNGWVFEGFEDAKTVVIETIVEELRRARPNSTKVADAARKVLKRVDWLKAARKAGGFALTAVTGIPSLDQIQSLAAGARALLGTAEEHLTGEQLKDFAEKAGDYLKEAEKEGDHLPRHMHEFRKEFEELIAAANVDQLVVIVDDLDRCLPETAIATLEAIRLFLFVPRTAFVVGADEMMIEYAVRRHFPDLPASVGSVPYARNYLEKLIQVPFRIPALGLAETRIYISLLLAQASLGPDDPRFGKLLDGAREDLKRPWLSRGLDAIAVTRLLNGPVPSEVAEAISISTHISTMLTEGTRGNPRQVKRFLNSMSLRRAIAGERGFGEDILMPVLAKLMLAESFSPAVYGQLARSAVSSSDGKVAALAQLEASVRTAAEPPRSRVRGRTREEVEDLTAAPDLEEWLKGDWPASWAAIDPPLGDVDLRPYVFATRDKRSFLGGLAAAATHLEGLIERLMGPKLAARAAEADVVKLSGSESEQVFEILASNIGLAEDLSREPKGLHGLITVVQTHSGLQPKLSAFLAGLPMTKLGAWAPTNFGAVLTEQSAAAEFKTLLESWAAQGDNAALKRAAAATLRLREAN